MDEFPAWLHSVALPFAHLMRTEYTGFLSWSWHLNSRAPFVQEQWMNLSDRKGGCVLPISNQHDGMSAHRRLSVPVQIGPVRNSLCAHLHRVRERLHLEGSGITLTTTFIFAMHPSEAPVRMMGIAPCSVGNAIVLPIATPADLDRFVHDVNAMLHTTAAH